MDKRLDGLRRFKTLSEEKQVLITIGVVAFVIIVIAWRVIAGVEREHAGHQALMAKGNLPIESTPQPKVEDVAASVATLADSKKAGPFAGSPLFGIHSQDYPPAPGVSYTCADAQKLRARAESTPTGSRSNDALPMGVFWESQSSPNQFIYYEYTSRLVVVCDGHNIATAVAPDRGISAKEEIVKFDQPHFGDWGHDGKFEFILFRGQCGVGPCIGLFHVIQIDGNKLRKLAEINADGVDTEQMSINGVSKTSIHIQATCYTSDYSPGFVYLAVLDYGGPQVLSLIPFKQIRVRSPELLMRMVPPASLGLQSEQQGFRRIQKVVLDAYEGKPFEELQKTYSEAVSSVSSWRGQPPLSCDPLAIVKMVSEEK